MFTTVCFDLDGTLLNSKKEIEPESKDAIRRLKENGVCIIFASARHFCEIAPYITECNLSESDYVISCDGQYIVDTAGNVIWENNFLRRKDIVWLNDRIKSEFTVCTDYGDYKFYNETFKKCIKRHIRKSGDSCNGKKKVSRFDIWFQKNTRKIEKVIINKKIRDITATERFTVRVFDTERTEVFQKGVTKYQAISELHKKGFIKSLDELLYFGDDYNDTECFLNIRHCVAMGTAPGSIKEKACFVTTSCDENGIAYALEKLAL